MRDMLIQEASGLFSGCVLKIYNFETHKEQTIVHGYAEVKPNQILMNEGTVFDVASLTKSFTAVLVYQALEAGLLQLNDTISSLDSRFKQLDDVSVLDLLNHRILTWTDGFLSKAATKEEFESILFSAKSLERTRKYIDTNYIILSTVLETIHHKSFKTLIEELFRKCNMKRSSFGMTHLECASNNYGNSGEQSITDREVGVVHDPKANHAYAFGTYTGHAGIFSTAGDMLSFLKALFVDFTLLKKETITNMLNHDDIDFENEQKIRNFALSEQIIIPEELDLSDMLSFLKEKIDITELENNIARTYNYFGTRYYNNTIKNYDAPNVSNGESIYFSGFTGSAYFIDFKKKNIIILMTNILHMATLERRERYQKIVTIFEKINNYL